MSVAVRYVNENMRRLARMHFKRFLLAVAPIHNAGMDVWRLKPDAPEATRRLLLATHDDGRVPEDDFRLLFTVGVLDMPTEAEEIEDGELFWEIDPEPEPLCRWLASSDARADYVDRAVENLGEYPGVVEAIRLGQLAEIREVLDATWRFLGGPP